MMGDVGAGPDRAASMRGSGFRDAISQSLGDLPPLAVLAATPRRLRNLVDRFDFTDPTLTTADGWSVAQTLYHFADSEAVFSVRLKSVLLAAEPELAGYDHDRWLTRIGERSIRIRPTLERFELLRAENLDISASLSEQDLARTGRHIAHGQESIGDLIKIRAGHDLLHLRPMEMLLAGQPRVASDVRGVPRGKDDPFSLPSKRGKLIVLCGIDGSGKTSQALELVDWLRTLGLCAEYHKAIGIRSELDYLARRIGYEDHIALFGADTGRLLGATVRWKSMNSAAAALRDESLWLVVDRYVYCEYAATRQQGADCEPLIREMYAGLPEPDLIFFLDVPPEEAFSRVGERGVDVEGLNFLKAFDAGYRSLPEMKSFTVIEAARDFAEIRAALRAALRERFPELADGHDR